MAFGIGEERRTLPLVKKLIESLDGKQDLVVQAGGAGAVFLMQRHNSRGDGSLVATVSDRCREEAVELRSCQLREALAQGSKMVSQLHGMMDVVPDGAGRVAARLQEQHEVAELRNDHAVIVESRPTDQARRHHDALEVHDAPDTLLTASG